MKHTIAIVSCMLLMFQATCSGLRFSKPLPQRVEVALTAVFSIYAVMYVVQYGRKSTAERARQKEKIHLMKEEFIRNDIINEYKKFLKEVHGDERF